MRNRGATAAGQGGTISLPDDQIEYGETKYGTHKHGSTGREPHPVRFTRGYGSFRMRPFVREPLQLPEIWPQGQDQQLRCPYMHLQRRKTRIAPVQVQQKSHIKVRKLWKGKRRHQSAVHK